MNQTTSWAEEARIEREKKARATKAAARKARFGELIARLPDAAVVAALLIAAALTHGPVFGGVGGYVAVLGGVLVGAAVAFAGSVFRLRLPGSLLLVYGAYLGFGGPLALPQTTTAFVVPTLRTLQMLVVGAITSWKDLLTVQPPAGVFVGPTIMPYLSGLLAAFVALTIVLRTSRALWSLLPISVFALLGILWGSQSAPAALVLGGVIGVVAISWAAVRASRKRQQGSGGVVEFEGKGANATTRRLVGGGAMVAASAAAAVAATTVLLADAHRTVIRDYVEPPLDLREYHSPVTQFRTLNTTDKDKELLRVTGLPQGGRLRLATLDFYDGTVMQIGGGASGAGFRHVGSYFTDNPLPAGATTREVNVEVLGYSGNWVPGGGELRGLEFNSGRSGELADALFYSDILGTALTTTRLQDGDAYTVTQVVDKQWSDAELKDKPIGQFSLPGDSEVPDVVAEVAATLTAEAEGGLGKVRKLEQTLHTEGFYSDGTDQLSLPGHRASRVDEFLQNAQMIGDDDQYAVVMALMLRSQGIPSRVVMGFYPEEETSGPVTFTGKDTHLWVEVPFEGAGWVPFDPTPPRDQVPQTEVPKPKPNPRQQVLQPPDPVEEPAEVPPDNLDDSKDEEQEKDSWLAALLQVLLWTGVGVAALSPFWILLLIKAMRTRRRRRKGSAEKRTSAAWDDVVDRATDLGIVVSTKATRYLQARQLDAQVEERRNRRANKANKGGKKQGATRQNNLAALTTESNFHRYCDPQSEIASLALSLDSVVFGAQSADDSNVTRAWNDRKKVIRELRKAAPWHRRLLSPLSTKSLRSRRRKLRELIGAGKANSKRAKKSELDPSNSWLAAEAAPARKEK